MRNTQPGPGHAKGHHTTVEPLLDLPIGHLKSQLVTAGFRDMDLPINLPLGRDRSSRRSWRRAATIPHTSLLPE